MHVSLRSRTRHWTPSPLFRRLLLLVQKRLVGEPDAILQRGRGAPAEFGEPADIEQFSRRAVRARRIEADLAAKAYGLGHHAREFGDGDVLAGADIDQLALRIILHQM